MSKAIGIDLDEVDVSKASEVGFEFEVAHPETGDGLGVFIKVRGEEAASVRLSAIRSESENIVRARMKDAGKSGKQSFEAQVAEMEAELRRRVEESPPEKAAERVISWRGVLRGGKPVPCTPENCIELFTKMPFVQAQVFEQSRRLGNFFQVPSAISATTPAKSSD